MFAVVLANGVILFGLLIKHADEPPFVLKAVSSVTLGFTIISCANLAALGWVGMWIGLQSKQSANAPWVALGLVMLPPWILFFITVMSLSLAGYWFRPFDLMVPFAVSLATGFVIVTNVFFSLWARSNLRHEFRTAATDRFRTPKGDIPWWKFQME